MYGFFRRQKLRQEKQHKKSQQQEEEILVQMNHVMKRWEEANIALDGETPSIQYHKGWFHIRGRRYRLARILEETGMLEAAFHERETGYDEVEV